MSLPFQLALGNNTPTTVTSAFGRIQLPDPTWLDIGGGAASQVLTTDGGSGLYWAPPTATGIDAPSDSLAYGRLSGAWARVVAVAGDTMTGSLVLSGPPTLPLHAVTKAYADLRPLDAPVDGVTYGRRNAAWIAVSLASLGGAPLASPVLTGDPQAPTPAPGDADTSIATTAFVSAAIVAAPNKLITLSGDVTGSGTAGVAATIPAGTVTYAKQQNVAAARLIGNPTGVAAVHSEISLGTNLSFAGSVLNAASGASGLSGMTAGQIPIAATATTITSSGNLSGDITTSGSLATTLATVNSNVGTFQGITVDGKGRVTAASNQSYAPIASPTFTGKVTTQLSGTGGAGFILPHGVAPTSPVNGDVWTTTGGMFARINNATVGPYSTSGSGMGGMTAGQIPIAATATTVTSSGNLSGDVTTTGSLATTIAANAVTTPKIINSAVSYAKIQNVAANRILGNSTGSPAAPAEIALPLTTALGGTGATTFAPPPGLGALVSSYGGSLLIGNGTAAVAPTFWWSFLGYPTGLQCYGDMDVGGTYGSPWLTMASSGGQVSARTATPNGQVLGSLQFDGYDGANWQPAAVQLQGVTTQAWTASANGAEFRVLVTPNGGMTTTRTIAMTVDGLGVHIGDLYLASNQIFFAGNTNPAVGPRLYVDTTNFAVQMGPGNGVLAVLNNAGATMVSMGANGGVGATLGYQCQAGRFGTARTNYFNIDWTTIAELWIDNVKQGQFAFVCDYRIKDNVAELGSTWDQVKALRPITYNYKACPELLREEDDPALRWGFLAHELQEALLPTAASGEKDAPNEVQSPDLVAICAAVTRALQEAMARIEALEA